MPTIDTVSSEAEAAFKAEYGAGPGSPIVVLIAALNEFGAVGAVVTSLPSRVENLGVECILVDDGSTDGTDREARQAGALVCRLQSNLGQGAALQVGYRLAADRGAEVIVTMDADGQFDPGEMARLVGPVLAGTADFVNGSRRLGRSETTDSVRQAGVVVFGTLLSALTGTKITDPANGYRAFRPAVPLSVAMRQVQYQTAELLIRAIGAGFRVVEVPVTLLPRAAGETKKGGNLRYGYRFGRVILTTWWSQRREPARVQPGS